MLRQWILALFVCGLVCAAVSPAWGVIERPLALKSLVGDSDFVFAGKVNQLDVSRPSMVIEVQSDLKGKAPMRRLPVLLKGTDDSGKEQVVPRLASGSAVVGFITIYDADDNPETPNSLIALVFLEGTWIQLQGTPAGESYRWQYTHIEPYLRRTFAGRSSDLATVVTNAIEGKKPWPEVDTAMKPGVGPKVGEEGNPTPTAASSTETAAAEKAEHGAEPDSAAGGRSPTDLPVLLNLGIVAGIVVVVVIVSVVAWNTLQGSVNDKGQPGK